jgi:hypothetical protein
VIVGLYGLAWSLQNKPRRWIQAAVAFALGCVSIWIAYAILYRISLPDLIAVGTRLASESTRCPICPSTTRSYALWAIWNPIDFATFFSVPLTVLFLVGVPAFIAAFRAFLGGHAQPRASWAPLAVAALAPFIVLDVAGIVRGEVGRMWMYFAPLFALIALAEPESAPVKAGRESLVLALLALQLLTLNTRWLVTPSFLDEPPTRQAVFDAAEPGVKAQAAFGHQIALTGYDAATSGMVIDLTLYWQALTQPLHAYTVFVHALDTSGKLVGQQDNMPVRDQLPTSCWQPGEYVADPYTVPLSAGARGPFSIEVGLYRLDTGQRLTLDGESATSVMLRVP